MSLFPFTALIKTSIAAQKLMLRELAEIKEVVNETCRRITAITCQKGLSLDLPVSLPLSSEADFQTLCTWLDADKARTSDLVRIVPLLSLLSHRFCLNELHLSTFRQNNYL